MSRGDFWSRRRAAVAAEEAAAQDAEEAARAAAAEAELEARPDEEILAERNLPDPDTLTSPEEVRAFLSETLPQRLKSRALRRLWRLNPVLANVDGLVDYGQDFTDSAMVIEKMQTAYQVGKGMLKHIEAQAELEAEATAQADTEAKAETDADTETAPLDDAEQAATPVPPAPEVASADAPAAPAPPPDEADAPVLPAHRRRMRFQFEMQT